MKTETVTETKVEQPSPAQAKPKSGSKTKNMRDIKIEKVVLNICAGAEQEPVKKAKILLTTIAGMNAVETKAKKRIATWKIRPGLPIGAKVTRRGKEAEELLARLLASLGNILPKKAFSANGFSFGIKEYIDIPGVKYDPKVGIIGLDVCVSLARPGYRVKLRKIKTKRLPKKHSISKEESAEFAEKKLGVKIA